MLTANEVEEAINDRYELLENSIEGTEGSTPFSDFAYKLEGRDKFVDLPIGRAELVDQYGGEGKGDDYWLVFKIGDQYFKLDGWYASYVGGEYNELVEVKAITKTVTVFEQEED